MSGNSKGSGLDIFDSLSKRESSLPSESGVVARGPGSKAPPPPPSRNSTAPLAPPNLAAPSLASLAAPLSSRPSKPPPPPTSAAARSLIPPPPPTPQITGRSVPPPPPSRSAPPPPPPSRSAPPPPSVPTARSAPPPSAPRNVPPSAPRNVPPSAPRNVPPSAPRNAAPSSPRVSAPPSTPRSLPPPPPSVPTADENSWPPPPAADALDPPTLNGQDDFGARNDFSRPSERAQDPFAASSASPPLPSYTGDAEDDLPTRLYSPSVPPPGATTTQPRNEKPRLVTQRTFAGRGLSRWWPPPKWHLIGVAIGVILASLLLYFTMRSGTLVVTVTGPAGRAIDSVEVFVDGAKRCDASPCIVGGLSDGAHLVRATAKGYEETAEQAIAVEAGQHAVQTIALSPTGAGTAVRVSALGSGLKLYVDGQEIGELPQTAKGIAPGEHTLRVAGSDRYEPWEEKVSIQEGETKNIGPLRLRVLKGLATFKAGAGAEGARVQLDGRLVPELPATIEVPAGKQLTLVAQKQGYSAYRRTISFNDGVAEKTFEITMAENGDTEGAPEDVGSRPLATGPSRHTSTHPPAPQAPAQPPVAKGKATLNLNSIPVSNVILNGKPLGPTPKIGVQVPPGPQTVVFVHPDLGRKVMSGTVAAGETKTFMARLR